MANAKRMTKDELREDKVLTAVKELREYAGENSQTLIILGVVLVAVIVGLTFFKNSKAQAEQQAGLVAAQATRLYYSGEFDGALAKFQEVASQYGSTRAAKSASLFLGNCELSAGDSAAAEKAFRDYLGTTSGGSLERAAAHRGIGASLFDQGNSAEAAAEYKNAAEIANNPLAADDWMAAGLAFTSSGDKAGAENAYRTVIDDYTGSARAQEARIRLQGVLAGS